MPVFCNCLFFSKDTFYYSLIYDPQARTLQPDKNSIRIGDKYQAQVPPGLAEKESKTPEETATPLWKPDTMSNKEIDQYMVLARYVQSIGESPRLSFATM